MERPFAHLLQLDKGLLASKCKIDFILHNQSYFNHFEILDHEWRSDRKHLNLAFNLNILKGFIPIFAQYSNVAISEMEKNEEGEDFDVLLPLASVAARTVSGKLKRITKNFLSLFPKNQ